MRFDIRTLVTILTLLSALQFFVFLYFILLNRGYRTERFSGSLGGWFLWSLLSALGYALLSVRESLPSPWIPFAVFLTNLLLFGADIFLYIGFASFFAARYFRRTVFAVCSAFVILTAFAVFIVRDVNFRGIVLYISMAVLLSLCAVLLFRRAPERLRKPACVLGVVFAAHALFLFVRTILSAIFLPFSSTANPPFLQILLFVIPMATSYLWSFGVIILTNQRSLVAHRDSERNLELAFNSNPDGVLLTHFPDGVIKTINDGFSRLFGYSREEIVGKATLDLGLWRDPTDSAHIYAQVARLGMCDNFETVMRRKDGSLLDSIVSGRTFTVGCEQFLVSTFHDISERKAMEMSLKQSEEKFRLLVENSYDIIYTLSSEGFFLFVSPVWTVLLGHDANSVVGTSFREYVFETDIPICEAFLSDVISSGQPKSGVEFRIRDARGKLIWYTSSAVPFRDASGRIAGFYGIGRDIQEQRQLRDELKLQATTDELTGICNRRHFIQLAANEIRRALRFGKSLSFALIDIDHFKSINDTHGHSAGDQALFFFARQLQENIREIDILARFGGDEFVILFPETSNDQSVAILERLRLSLAATPVVLSSSTILYLTISAGVTQMVHDSGDVFDALINRADQALYRAKAAGRDCISL